MMNTILLRIFYLILVISGLIVGGVTISQHRESESIGVNHYQELEQRVEDLRAQGAIVENYYVLYQEAPNQGKVSHTIFVAALSFLSIVLGGWFLRSSFKQELDVVGDKSLNEV